MKNSIEILSILVSVSAIIYSIITVLMYRENVRARELKSEPLILAFLKSSEDSSSFSLHLKNVGEGPAKDVSIKLIKDFLRYGKTNNPLSKGGIFAKGLTIFPSGYEMKFILDFWQNVTVGNIDNFIELEIKYHRFDGKKRSQLYKLNFEEILGQYYSNPPDTYVGQIAYQLKEFNKEFKKTKI